MLIPPVIYLGGALICFLALVTWGAAVTRRQQEIVSVVDGSPAQSAGLRHGDVLVSIDGQPADVDHSARDIVQRSEGRAVRVRFERAGTEQELMIEPRNGLLGMQLFPLESCERLPPGRAAWYSLITPARNAWALMGSLRRRIHAELSGPVGIRVGSESTCARRNAYVANLAGGLGILSLLSLPIIGVVAVRRAQRANPSVRSPQ